VKKYRSLSLVTFWRLQSANYLAIWMARRSQVLHAPFELGKQLDLQDYYQFEIFTNDIGLYGSRMILQSKLFYMQNLAKGSKCHHNRQKATSTIGARLCQYYQSCWGRRGRGSPLWRLWDMGPPPLPNWFTIWTFFFWQSLAMKKEVVSYLIAISRRHSMKGVS